MYFCIAFEKRKRLGPVAQLNRAPHYGCGGCGFESRRDHKSEHRKMFTLFFVSISIGRDNHNQLFFNKKQHSFPILHSTLYIIYSAENALFTAIRDQEKRFHPKKQNRTNALFHSSTRPRLFCHFFPIIREKHDEIGNISFRNKKIPSTKKSTHQSHDNNKRHPP